MTPRKRGKSDGAASPDAGGDRISALPDDVLHHVLSFLPAEEAVRTCVLAQRWRHLWKAATGLRIGFSHVHKPPSVVSVRNFVNHLLLLRKRDSCLHTCDLRLRPKDDHDWLVEERTNLKLWIRHVVEHEVRMLRLEIRPYFGFGLDDLPLVSQQLKMLALIGVLLNSPCNFSSCPNLEHLEITKSMFREVPRISSKSVKHLSISDCRFEYGGLHTLICTPSLVSLRLDCHFCWSVPVLSSMPSLKNAFARDKSGNCVIPDKSDYKNKCILLQGLAEAQNLTLMSGYNGVFRRDLEWCPNFNNLRTLLLNEWCLDPDLYSLNLILKKSPVLEKLSLHLFTKGTQHKMEMIGRYNQMGRSPTILKHLKEIEIKCDVVNEQLYKILKFLGTFGIGKRVAKCLFFIIYLNFPSFVQMKESIE